ncbi:zinc finger and SCAN domain-containing protein 2-like isoform X4 [Hemicordylus capensis]|uniref:zinc finger and SCAN domain-containing protein 2-like isoform X4 n=1 Tax=Hemicordylus capensis TaxID=884348 RepID=UPI00230358E5|nr:zinc finger and SCAN domain-containing protein 2-like isoform X4 [Hemicordylus capensis]
MAAQQHTNKMATSSGDAMDPVLPLQIRVKMEAQCQAESSARGGDGKFPSLMQSGTTEELLRGTSASREMQDWIRERGPETCDQAVALAEEFLQEQQVAKRWEQQALTAVLCDLIAIYEITVPIEMVIVNSPIIDQAISDTAQRHPHREAKQDHIEDCSSQAESNFVNHTRAKEAHQGEPEAEEQQRRPQGTLEFVEDTFPRSDPIRPYVSERGLGRQQKSCLSMRVITDRGLGGVLTDPEAKRHLCKECGKRFRKKWDLIRHERIHTGEKPYQCPECGNSFNRNTTLTKHLLIHSGEKPHQCAYCGKRFTRRSHVVNHQRRHSCQGRS